MTASYMSPWNCSEGLSEAGLDKMRCPLNISSSERISLTAFSAVNNLASASKENRMYSANQATEKQNSLDKLFLNSTDFLRVERQEA